MALGCGLYFYSGVSMTVKELREALEGVPDEYEVEVWSTNTFTLIPTETRGVNDAYVALNESVFTIDI